MTDKQQELIYAIALTKVRTLNAVNIRLLMKAAGSATEVYAHRKDIKQLMPEANERLAAALNEMDYAVQLAEREMEFINSKRMRAMTMQDDEYPQRMLECEDAPLVLYCCGDVDLNRQHVINIIGTRKCTEYGRELCYNFVTELKQLVPDVLIVSGLAYGIDINAHRASLANGIDTVGVLAHGLDNIYPHLHRQTAIEMVNNGGGLLTEYTTNTTPEKGNFVARNRIVAGISDACVVVESAARGGSLITAGLSLDYNREVFAFPGRVSDLSSAGCNNLIAKHEASLITCAEDMVNALGWTPNNRKKAVQQELFVELTEEETAIVNALAGVDDKHINQLAIDTNISYSRVSMLLFELEMKGIIKALGGARYHLIRRNG